MWRPATRNLTGTNDVPLANKRRFGLPEEAPPSGPAPSGYGKPPSDSQFFNGRVDRDRERVPQDRDDRRDDRYDRDRRDDYDRDRRPRDDDRRRDYDDRDRGRDSYGRDREGGGGGGRSSRWDDDRGRGRDGGHGDDAPRKRRSRWGDASDRADVAGLPVNIMGKVSQSELDNYAIHVRLEEINRKLRTGDVVPPDGQRSPSPPPKFDAYGRRSNTRELRYKQKLEDERNRLVDRAMKNDPNFRPPLDMQQRRNGRPMEKVYIPVHEFPEINFFGLLVGPRGNSLKRMERESGAKISIRGKGSVKDGKGRSDAFANDEDDELHCVVTADDEQKVRTCVQLINKVIETAASTPEGQNDHKRNQLRELASLNGTLRDDENQLCQNCGEKGHRRWECPQQRMYSANVICRLCGGAGHMARDCRGRGDPSLAQNNKTQFDSEFSALMAELGETPGGDARPQQQQQQPQEEQRVPPWRIPENWHGGGRRHDGPPGGGFGGGGGGGGYGGGYGGQDQGYGGGGGGGGYGGRDQGYGGGGNGDQYASYYASIGQAA
ncbi:hypothetical protein Q8F55_000612 [Vanrija albida]|uniref:Branchpoint-bridging protein n=1 Tax=Vanrija albida TaxID=181172 RepID=A0ABR3QEN3_9TREE